MRFHQRRFQLVALFLGRFPMITVLHESAAGRGCFPAVCKPACGKHFNSLHGLKSTSGKSVAINTSLCGRNVLLIIEATSPDPEPNSSSTFFVSCGKNGGSNSRSDGGKANLIMA